MSKITLEDIRFISTQPRVGGKVIIDDWNKLLKFEHNRWIRSFEGFDDGEWIAPLTSRGKEIIDKYEETDEIKLDDFFNRV